ncbi:MAG: hypothetical protein WDA01_01005, partial [Methanothrix sp.]
RECGGDSHLDGRVVRLDEDMPCWTTKRLFSSGRLYPWLKSRGSIAEKTEQPHRTINFIN